MQAFFQVFDDPAEIPLKNRTDRQTIARASASTRIFLI
jgi:hypothetical protein